MDARLQKLELYRQTIDGRRARGRFLLAWWGAKVGAGVFCVTAASTLLFALYAYLDYEVNVFAPRVTDFHRSRFA